MKKAWIILMKIQVIFTIDLIRIRHLLANFKQLLNSQKRDEGGNS